MNNYKVLEIRVETEFYTIARNGKKIIPIIVTEVNENNLTLRNKIKVPAMFNCEGTFTFDEFIKMMGMSLFVEPSHAAEWKNCLQKNRLYNVDDNYDVIKDNNNNTKDDKTSAKPDKTVEDEELELAKAINTLLNAIIKETE